MLSWSSSLSRGLSRSSISVPTSASTQWSVYRTLLLASLTSYLSAVYVSRGFGESLCCRHDGLWVVGEASSTTLRCASSPLYSSSLSSPLQRSMAMRTGRPTSTGQLSFSDLPAFWRWGITASEEASRSTSLRSRSSSKISLSSFCGRQHDGGESGSQRYCNLQRARRVIRCYDGFVSSMPVSGSEFREETCSRQEAASPLTY